MKSRLEKVLDKMPNKKVDLKAHKVTLSLVDDIQNELNGFEDAFNDAQYLGNSYGDEIIDKISDFRNEVGQIDDFIINGSVRNLEEVSEKIGKALEELEVKAEELGVNPNDILNDFDYLKERVNNSFSVNNEARAKYKEIVQYAGFLNDFWK